MKIKNKINGKIGFEIECVMSRENEPLVREIVRENNWVWQDDCSIQEDRKHPISAEIKFHYSVTELDDKLSIIKKLFSLIKSNSLKYNCGGHIHISFEDSEDYFKLCNYKFAQFFQDEYTKFAKTKEDKIRMDLQNYYKTAHFCRFYTSKLDFESNVREQLRAYGKNNRFFCINFNSFNTHNTIEFRIFSGTNNINSLIKRINLIFSTIKKFEYSPITFNIEKELPIKKQKIIINKQSGFSKEIPGIQNE